MPTGLHAPNTRAGRAMNEVGNSGERSDVMELGSGVTDNSSVVDEYSLSVQDKADLGIAEHETVVYGARESVIPRRFAALRRKYGEARAITKNTVTGEDPCAHMDLQMIAVPKAAYEAIEEKRRQRAKDYEDQFIPRRDMRVKETQLFERTPENYALRRSINEEMFESMGIGQNGMTAGMSLAEGLAYLQRQGLDPNAIADQARIGAAHRRDNQTAWKAAMRGEKAPARSFAMGDAGIGDAVTPKSALGQVREKNARAAKAAR